MSLVTSRPRQNEGLPTEIINVSFDETLCPHYTHTTYQLPTIVTRTITLEANIGTINLEGNLGALTLD